MSGTGDSPPRAPRPIVLSWSGGKDSSLALQTLLGDPAVRVAGLLTTVTAGVDRVSIHGVRRSLLERQAASLRLPLHVVEIDPGAGNESYERAMSSTLASLGESGIDTVAFGDLHLSDVREYRERMMTRVEMRACFPLWGRETRALAHHFVDSGYRAIVTCVDTEQLDPSFVGRWLDHSFLRDLPTGVDPCGENGEFHTFVVDGPILPRPLVVRTGERVLRDERFQFCDLLPVGR